MKKRFDKIEKYVESRLWNVSKAGKSIPSGILLDEIKNYYKVDIDIPDVQENVLTLIRKVRNRIINRKYHWRRKRRQWADILRVSEELVEKWWTEGIITNKRSVMKIEVVLKDINYP